MEEIDIPPFFICPISLQIMKDPVTVSTGITYDRESIEKWLFSNKNNTCPVTKQVLSDSADLTPNHTLRRLIQSWCTINASHGIERFPTPKPPINKTQITKLLNESKKSPLSLQQCLRQLRSMASESETNRRSIESSGAVQFLASVVINSSQESSSEEAVNILYNLGISESGLRSLANNNGTEFLNSLKKIMQNGSSQSRTSSIMLLKSLSGVADPNQLNSFKTDFFIEIIQVIKDQISQQATKSALQILINLCTRGRNRLKAVEAGGVSVLIELLLSSSEKKVFEMTLVGLDLQCKCAEGRAELLNHGAGLAVVSKKILMVSGVGSERALRILYSISKFSGSSRVVQEMLNLGIVGKLCLLIQMDCGNKITEKAREILKLHSRAWRNSSCIPGNLISLYPL